MPKKKRIFICSVCGYKSVNWLGGCPNCGSWGSFQEVLEDNSKDFASKSVELMTRSFLDIPIQQTDIVATDIKEVDRVLGGGVVLSSVILLAGEPGIGKSTLSLQIAGAVGRSKKVLYISAEETVEQVRRRGERLGINSPSVYLLFERDVDNIISVVEKTKPDLLIVDSIQMLSSGNYSSMAGSVFQVREVASRLTEVSKSNEITTIIVGHITKEGSIAGPKTLEHVVDVVTILEGDKRGMYRIFRATKNRFGPANEVGILEMGVNGLSSVENPHRIFLSEDRPVGSSVGVVVEGLKPIVVEVQALVTRSYLSFPRRVATAFDINRLHLIIAVLEKRVKIYLGKHDVYANIVGGIRFSDTSLDLPMSVAIASSMKDIEIPQDVAFIGELGLGGEIRLVPYVEKRVLEAIKLGFSKVYCPAGSRLKKGSENVIEVSRVGDVLKDIL